MFLGQLRKIIRLFKYQVNICQTIGFKDFLRYRLSARGQLVLLSINNVAIFVRKGTPDLTVAMSCLGGEFNILRYLPLNQQSALIVDAGGYIGASALALNIMFPNARILVIEPSFDNLRVLQKNTSGVDKIEVIHGALVGRKSGLVELRDRDTGEWGYTIVAQNTDHPNPTFLHSVPSYTLSDLPTMGSQIDLLKLDIEGAELDLMTYDSDTLQSLPFIFVELHDRIKKGCEDTFYEFSKNRVIIKDHGEKYLSMNVQSEQNTKFRNNK